VIVENSEPAESVRLRWWTRFSLRELLLAMTAICGFAAAFYTHRPFSPTEFLSSFRPRNVLDPIVLAAHPVGLSYSSSGGGGHTFNGPSAMQHQILTYDITDPSAEELLVTMMLQEPSVIATVDREGALDDFDDGPWRELAVDLVESSRRAAPLDSATVLGRLDDAIAARITGRLLASGEDEAMRQQIVVDCLAKLRHRARERERLRVLRRIREAEALGNLDAVAEGQRQLQALRQSETSEPF
jgi:hypothetical protein